MAFPRTFQKATIAGLLACGAFAAALVPLAHAQTSGAPRLFITWKALNSYVPSFYQGKALPSYGTKLVASIEAISSNGKLIDLHSQPIFWYVNETLVGGGTGVQTVTFPPFGTPPSTLSLTVTIPQYPGGGLEGAMDIPYVSPVAVIDAPYPSAEFSTNPVAVNALPFYFDTPSSTRLSYTWEVNGQTGGSAEDPSVANITLPQNAPGGTALDISLTIKNSSESTVATAEQTITYQGKL